MRRSGEQKKKKKKKGLPLSSQTPRAFKNLFLIAMCRRLTGSGGLGAVVALKVGKYVLNQIND